MCAPAHDLVEIPMKIATSMLVALCLGASAFAARADSVRYQLQDVTAQLHDTPCVNASVQQMLREPDQFRAADIVWQGQPFSGCWAVIGTQIIMVDETGDSGVLPAEGFSGGQLPVSLRRLET
jgi:hypothetical protein